MPIGQREWINRTNLSVKHHKEPEWVPRVAEILLRQAAEREIEIIAWLEGHIKQIIAQHFGWPEADITLEKTLSINSEDFDNKFIMQLEERFGIEIPVEEAKKIVSLQTAIDCVKVLL